MHTFDNLLLLGRPAAGKSEFIDALKRTSDSKRAESFHIGRLEELDDFVWIWEKFIEDDLWEKAGFERIYSHREGDNMGLNEDQGKLFDLMLVKFNKEVEKYYTTKPEFYDDGTLFIEFSRGREDGYRNALSRLSEDVLKNSVILYVNVSFDESWRRNVARYEEKKMHSILAHMATKRVMESFYKIDDWDKITGGEEAGYVEVQGIKIPFVTVLNEPEIKEPGALLERYGPYLDSLMGLLNNR